MVLKLFEPTDVKMLKQKIQTKNLLFWLKNPLKIDFKGV